MGALEEVRDLAEAVTRRRSLRLWDVEMAGQPGRAIVRVYVEGDEGVDLDTVAEVSEEISRGLDLRDPIQGRYTLEVSSPGLDRPLRKPEHFSQAVGRKVSVRTARDVAGRRRFRGQVVRAGEGAVTLDAGDEIDVPYDEIVRGNLIYEG